MDVRNENFNTNKHPKKDSINVILDPIAKPNVISNLSPSIYIDKSYFFYTFDGRSLFFSKEQKQPIISVPEETKNVYMINYNNVIYCFSLSSKNRLECFENNSESIFDKKYVITRNVISLQKTNEAIYYLFKKDIHYFINKCFFDGKKWIGKTVFTSIEAKDIELFATGNTFFFTKDTFLFNASGDDLEMQADFVHKYENLIVVGMKYESEYCFDLFNSEMTPIDKISIPTIKKGIIKASNDIIIQQIN